MDLGISMNKPQRIVALDFGKKRCGLAVTDPLRLIASPLKTLDTKDLKDFLNDFYKQEGFSDLVIGIAPKYNGELNPIEEDIQKTIKDLKKLFPEVEFHREDESFTSKEASESLIASAKPKKKRQQKGALDDVSAAIILQRFLESI